MQSSGFYKEKIAERYFQADDLMKKLIVKDRSRKLILLRSLGRLFHSRDASLAKYFAVLLAGNFFRHLEHHLHQRILRKALQATHQCARLAEVSNNALAPGAEVFHPIADLSV